MLEQLGMAQQDVMRMEQQATEAGLEGLPGRMDQLERSILDSRQAAKDHGAWLHPEGSTDLSVEDHALGELSRLRERVSAVVMCLASSQRSPETPVHGATTQQQQKRAPRVRLEALRVPEFGGKVLGYPAWRRKFMALVGSQGFEDAVPQRVPRDP